MKLKLLAMTILGINLVGCATQPVTQNSSLSQKVYKGYEHLVGKESYAFSGRAKLEITDQNKPKSLKSNASGALQNKKNLLHTVVPFEQLSPQQKQWMAEGLDASEKNVSLAKADQIRHLIKTITGRFFYDYDGVVDLGRGQISFDSKFGYEAKNAQAWMKVPVTLDFKQDSIYADLSAFSPFLTDPNYDGRYIQFDLKELIHQSGFNKKPLLEVIRDYMLVNAVLAKDSDYQRVALTAEKKQQGIAEHIRYTVSYEELMAQYALYFYLNQNYLKNILPLNSDALEQSSGALIGSLMTLGNVNSLKSAEPKADKAPVTVEQHASLAKDRLVEALELAAYQLDTDVIENVRRDAELAADVAGDTSASESENAVSDDTILGALTTQIAGGNALAKFDFYQAENELVSAKYVKKIITEQPEAYQKLIESVRNNSKELGFPLDKPLIVDMGFDQKGRLMRSEMAMDFSLGQPYLDEAIMIMDINFHDYGNARVDEKVFKNAVKWSEAVNKNTIVGGKKLEKDRAKVESSSLDSKNWSNTQRYHHLAKSLLAQNMNFIDAYTLVYRYGYLLEDNTNSIKDDAAALVQLNNTGRWNAIYYAQENGLAVTAAQAKEYEDSPEDWYYYNEELSDDIWTEFDKIMGDQRYANLYQTLRVKHKDDAALFSAIYYAMDEAIEKKRNGLEEIEYPEGFDKFVKLIGQIAITDIKTGKIDQTKIEQFDERGLSWFEEDIYEKTYTEFLKHR